MPFAAFITALITVLFVHLFQAFMEPDFSSHIDNTQFHVKNVYYLKIQLNNSPSDLWAVSYGKALWTKFPLEGQ